jgi:ABC-type dipeptide/oligopeptide/nickel transport system ATPase component
MQNSNKTSQNVKNSYENAQNLVDVRNLAVDFLTDDDVKLGVKDVSFTIRHNEVFALIGESGSGKSVSAKAILNLFDNNAHLKSGEILVQGQDILQLDKESVRKIRGQKVAMIFQDPFAALNPTLRIGTQIGNTLINHRSNNGVTKVEAKQRAVEMLKLVGIEDAEKRYRSYPHEFSGGQQQRICIAMALIGNPELLIADEPTTALDVTVQLQILNLLRELKQSLGFSILFITHDLAVVSNIADRIAVMKDGQIIETGSRDQIFKTPQHSYTQGLIAIAKRDYRRGERLLTVDDFASRELSGGQTDRLREQ